jgi:ketosteroid isomerase-like protein
MQGETYAELEVRQHADVAVVTGVVKLQASYQGQDVSGTNLFTKGWMQDQGRWQALALHACLPPSERR